MGTGASTIGPKGEEVVTIDWAARPTYHRHEDNVQNIFPNES